MNWHLPSVVIQQSKATHLYSEIGNVCVQSDPITLSTIKVLETKYANSSEIKWSQILGHIQKNDVISIIYRGERIYGRE